MRAHLYLGDDGPRRLAAFEQAVKDWRSQISAMDFDVFDVADPAQVMRAAGALRMPPLDGPARLAVWKNLHALSKPSPAVQAELEEAIPNAHPDVVLIAEGATGAAVKGRPITLVTPIRPLGVAIAKAEIHGFSKPPWWSQEEQQKLVVAMAKEAGVALPADLAVEMLQMVGTDTGRIGAALAQLALLGEPVTKRVLRSLLVADHADLESFHLLAVRGKVREALRLIPQFEVSGMKPAEAIIRLQNLAMRTMAVAGTKAKDDAAVAVISGIPEKQLYFRRKEWGRLKPARCEAALSAATDLAADLGQGRKLNLAVLLRTYLALSCGA